jgi:hypothetical protein
MTEKIYERGFCDFGPSLSVVIPTGRCKRKTIIRNETKIVHDYIEVYKTLFGFKIGTRWVDKADIVIQEVTEEIYNCHEN